MSIDSTAHEVRAETEIVVSAAGEFPPGEHRIVRVRNMEIGLYNVDGTYYALHNMCPHQFGPLCKGPVSGAVSCTKSSDWRLQWGRVGQVLTCPWHGIEFDLKTGRSLAVKDMQVRTFPVRVIDGEVRLQVGMRARSG